MFFKICAFYSDFDSSIYAQRHTIERVAVWHHSQVVRQRSATPSPPVRVRVVPPVKNRHFSIRIMSVFVLLEKRLYLFRGANDEGEFE